MLAANNRVIDPGASDLRKFNFKSTDLSPGSPPVVGACFPRPNETVV